MKRHHLAAAGLLALGLAACDSSTAPAEEFDFALDMALIAADAVTEDLGVMGLSVPSGIAGAEGSVERTVTRDRTFFDATGAEMDRYDPLLTASIVTVTETSGAASRGPLELTLERERTTTVTGLEGEETERTFNGSGSQSRTRVVTTDEFGTRSYDLSGTSATVDVIRAVDRIAQPWPLSGTITRSITVEITNGPNGDETRSTTITVTFNGTQFAEANVDGEIFEIDLDARDRNRVRRRG